MEHLDLPHLPLIINLNYVCGPNISIIYGLPIVGSADGYYRLMVSYSKPSILPPTRACPDYGAEQWESSHLGNDPKAPYGYNLFITRSFLDNLARQAGIRGSLHFPSNRICNQEIHYLAETFFKEARRPQEGHNLMIQSLETQLAISILRSFPSDSPLAATDKRNINMAIDYIRMNYREHFSLARLARAANYSNYHFIRVFKGQTGKTPFDYLMNVRVEKAAEMLLESKSSITDICFACGFTNPSHFTTVFKRKKGVTPSCYQKINSE